jgi:hypothetical protein
MSRGNVPVFGACVNVEIFSCREHRALLHATAFGSRER